jgi:hypothetical protein
MTARTKKTEQLPTTLVESSPKRKVKSSAKLLTTMRYKKGIVTVYTANNYDNLEEGYHPSYSLEGTLCGLVIYDCCPYVVVEKDGVLSIHGQGDTGLEQFDTMELN